MHATILDSNVLRGTDDQAFSQLLAAEHRHGILPLADVWTLIELIANLADPSSLDYQPCRSAIRRATSRSLREAEPRVVFPPEAEIARLLFGHDPPDLAASVADVVETCRFIADAPATDDLQVVWRTIESLAQHVAEKEAWFAEYVRALAAQFDGVPYAPDEDPRSRRKQVRAFLRSPEARRLDAVAMIRRAYDQIGRPVPDPIPDHQVATVVDACRAGSAATAAVLERVLCDGANPDKDRIRNLLWDQEVAFQIGQHVNGLPVLLVTDDGFFAQAVAPEQLSAAVQRKAEYWATLGLSVAV